ncbi:MAG: DMT family transporter [Methanobrevibacter boviskoreani]|jgi:quaternary ammonium compound-resistance protein SugE|uniref:DMT family transporter n=1 Tax=Methanobrevibacter boviskoreani TaxID=1348249 RepID=UPI002590CC40|nr:multidrug efflux SMR transporter [uncultured Methanobrevibacter sp.]
MNPWIYLCIAGIFEMLWAVSLKLSDSFTKIVPTIGFIIALILSMLFLSFSYRSIPMGTAYACWTAIGAVSICIVGMIFFNEPMDLIRIFFLSLVIVGIVGLKLTTPS